MWRPWAQKKEIMKIVYLALAPVGFACYVAHPSTEKWMIKKVCVHFHSPCFLSLLFCFPLSFFSFSYFF